MFLLSFACLIMSNDSPIAERFQSCKTLADFEVLYPSRQLPPEAQVVRFGPSPTGMPHIGSMMHATLDWSLARKTGGVFILRIEDTDQARLVPGATDALVETHKWLGTVPNEGPLDLGGAYGPYLQSQRLPLYQVAAKHLVACSHAYHCFCTPERLRTVRDDQTRAGQTTRYDGHCRELDIHEVSQRLAAREASVIRQKIPTDRKIVLNDLVRGRIEFDSSVIDDGVLLKSDGFPTYHLAVVVDDHFMRVTNIIRGEEWISSSPKHLLMYEAFGWEKPEFLHTVLLRNENRKKLSKRDGDTSVDWFKAEGYIPPGITNFLTRTMWTHPEGKDVYSKEEFSRLVEPSSLPNTGPVADMKLLNFINGHYISHYSADSDSRRTPEDLRLMITEYLGVLLKLGRLPSVVNGETGPKMGLETIEALRTEITANPGYADRVFALEPERHQKLGDVLVNCPYFFDATFRQAGPALFEKICPDATKIPVILTDVAREFDPTADHATWETGMRAIGARHEVKDKMVFMLTRVAATGQDRTPPLYDVINLIGSDRFLQRLAKAGASIVQNGLGALVRRSWEKTDLGPA